MQTIEEQVYYLLKQHNITLSTAESATGGMIASMLVNVPGISEFFQEGYVTYSNDAKVKMIGVERSFIEQYGVVSHEVAENMAISVAKTAGTDAALSVTGVAGPDGGTAKCPVGTIYIGCFYKGQTLVEHHVFCGNRMEVREAAARRALSLLVECISENEKFK
ncbi:MAG: CinA family protein [Roseburia sp.]|nr:CinA family protein [Roseburia sp.]